MSAGASGDVVTAGAGTVAGGPNVPPSSLLFTCTCAREGTTVVAIRVGQVIVK